MTVQSIYKNLTSIGLEDSDGEQLKIQKGFLVTLALFMSGGGLVWGTIAFSYELYLQSIIPFGYVFVSILNMLYFWISKQIRPVRFIQILFSLLLPFLFQWLLGGFFSTGTVMLWAVLAIIAAFTFQKSIYLALWLLLYIVLTIISGVYQDFFVTLKPDILSENSVLFSVINITVISSLIFGLVWFYVSRYKQAELKITEEKIHLNQANRKLTLSQRKLKSLLIAQKKEKEKIEYLNKQAESIFQNVSQGIFLLKPDFVISEFYSASLEKIFSTDKLAGANLIQLLNKYLIKSDFESFEIYAKSLFSPKVKDRLLDKANPLERVEIFIAVDGDIISRFLSFSFTRIKKENEVIEILVNVVDRTETVELEKIIEKKEKDNQRQSFQLLSILKVNPIVLKDFLGNAESELDVILEIFETSNTNNILSLLKRTFTIIHNLKGNAYLVDLEFIGEKLHSIETIIVELEKKDSLEGKDLLSIVIGIDEIKKDIHNMNNMYLKIREVNNVIDAQDSNANKLLKETLIKRVKEIAEKYSKSVDLVFEDEGFGVPDKFRIVIKDSLIQLINNSIVHGIETEEERSLSGKPRQGVIKIKLKTDQNNLSINYEDDGIGIDQDKIEAHFISNNLMNKDELDKLEESEKLELIFNEGFSTSESVTNEAGRGHGMSVIKKSVEENNGIYLIDSTTGTGFKFFIRLPLNTHQIAND